MYLQNPASGDALTKLQDDVDETKIILVSEYCSLLSIALLQFMLMCWPQPTNVE